MAATTAAAAVRPRRPWSALPLFARVEAPPQLPPVNDAASIFRGFSWPDDAAAVLSSPSVFNALGAPPFPSITTTTTMTPSPPAAATSSSSSSVSPTAPAPPPRPRIQHHRRPSASSSSPQYSATDDAPSMEEGPAPAPAPEPDPVPEPLGDAAVEDAPSSSEQAASSSSSSSSSAAVLAALGIPLLPPNSSPSSPPRAWRCAFPGCSSRVAFTRGCDLRKHHRRHSQRWFCRVDAACPRSATARGGGGSGSGASNGDDDDGAGRRWWFASKKDRDRHEAKHCPRIRCSWRGEEEGGGCGRVFSRLDNMKDHVRRVHGG